MFFTDSCNFFVLKNRSCSLELVLGKVVLEICSKFTGEHPCQSVKQLY